ncbi:hypothetical protein FE345_00580 [Helicobacter pylori]|nr:hypothetical protein FE345_00580 [Helicobacter pylori]
MDLKGLENALNNGDFKEQVYSSLEGICQISKVLNQLDILKNFNEHNLEIIAKIQAMKNALADYETSEQELKVKINALVNSLETRKQELEALLNTQLKGVRVSEEEKLTQAASELKTQLIAELTQAKDNLAQALKPQIQDATKFLGIFIYGRQSFFKNESDNFSELFEFNDILLSANKNYIVQFSMPYELVTNGVYSDSMGEIVLCLKANSKVYPIINSFYQNKTSSLNNGNKSVDTCRIDCAFKTPSEEADYKIACFARKHKDLWVNVNYSINMEGFEASYLRNAHFGNLINQSLPIDHNNKDWMFYKKSQILVYEILE